VRRDVVMQIVAMVRQVMAVLIGGPTGVYCEVLRSVRQFPRLRLLTGAVVARYRLDGRSANTDPLDTAFVASDSHSMQAGAVSPRHLSSLTRSAANEYGQIEYGGLPAKVAVFVSTLCRSVIRLAPLSRSVIRSR
jgi:hypothetical protein